MITEIWLRCPKCGHLHVERATGFHRCRRDGCACTLAEVKEER